MKCFFSFFLLAIFLNNSYAGSSDSINLLAEKASEKENSPMMMFSRALKSEEPRSIERTDSESYSQLSSRSWSENRPQQESRAILSSEVADKENSVSLYEELSSSTTLDTSSTPLLSLEELDHHIAETKRLLLMTEQDRQKKSALFEEAMQNWEERLSLATAIGEAKKILADYAPLHSAWKHWLKAYSLLCRADQTIITLHGFLLPQLEENTQRAFDDLNKAFKNLIENGQPLLSLSSLTLVQANLEGAEKEKATTPFEIIEADLQEKRTSFVHAINKSKEYRAVLTNLEQQRSSIISDPSLSSLENISALTESQDELDSQPQAESETMEELFSPAPTSPNKESYRDIMRKSLKDPLSLPSSSTRKDAQTKAAHMVQEAVKELQQSNQDLQRHKEIRWPKTCPSETARRVFQETVNPKNNLQDLASENIYDPLAENPEDFLPSDHEKSSFDESVFQDSRVPFPGTVAPNLDAALFGIPSFIKEASSPTLHYLRAKQISLAQWKESQVASWRDLFVQFQNTHQAMKEARLMAEAGNGDYVSNIFAVVDAGFEKKKQQKNKLNVTKKQLTATP